MSTSKVPLPISIRRRQILKSSLAAMALPSTMLAAAPAIHAGPAAGKPLRIMFPELPYFELLKTLLKKFSENTGIRIEIDVFPYLDMRQVQLKELRQSKGKYDLITMLAAWKTEYASQNMLADLDKEQSAGRLHLQDAGDLVPAYLTVAGKVGGARGYLDGPSAHLFALPVGSETSILAYRADIFHRHGLKPPATYDELLPLLNTIKLREPGMQPLCSRGQRGHHVTHAWLLHFNSFGGEVFDARWHCKVHSPAGIRAIEVLQAIHATTSGGILKNSYADMCNAFISGDAAMYLDSTNVFALVNDSVKSLVQDNVAYALHPKGTVHSSETGGFAFAMPKNAPSPARAMQLLGWITAPQQDKTIARKGGAPTRVSTMRDAELQIIYPEYSILSKQLEHANPNWRPIIPEWTVIDEQILGTLLHDAVAGILSPSAALEQAQEKITELMRRGGHYRS
ncbi:ABC transporter substrate-binding protein [Undibacterium sp.]|uniref:ABC transporter substrate-binding protein n=1 Tax=Undibacterium sp. TaxID=1914977 RepID=UPI002D0CAC58|nr:extracellular solute-binding protein [Undibacterium sp.]HTD03320.1 extracellular solute-binding protein [Undibacterium sp.]